MRKNTKLLFSMIIIGVMLFGTGCQAITDLFNEGKDSAEKLKEGVTETKENIENTVEGVKDTVEDTKNTIEGVKETVENTKEAIDEKTE